MIGFLLNNNLAPIGSSVISTCSPTDLFEQRERNVPLASADVRGGGILRDEPKERLRRRLEEELLSKIQKQLFLYFKFDLVSSVDSRPNNNNNNNNN